MHLTQKKTKKSKKRIPKNEHKYTRLELILPIGHVLPPIQDSVHNFLSPDEWDVFLRKVMHVEILNLNGGGGELSNPEQLFLSWDFLELSRKRSCKLLKKSVSTDLNSSLYAPPNWGTGV